MNGGGDSAETTGTDVHSVETSHPKETSKSDRITTPAARSGESGSNTTTDDGDPNPMEKADGSVMEEEDHGEPVTKSPRVDQVVDTGDTEMISEEEDFSSEDAPDVSDNKDADLLVTDEELLISSDEHDEVVIPLCDGDDSLEEVTVPAHVDDDPLAGGDVQEQDQNASNEGTNMDEVVFDESLLPSASELEGQNGDEGSAQMKSPRLEQRDDLTEEESDKSIKIPESVETEGNNDTVLEESEVTDEESKSKPKSVTDDIEKTTTDADIIEVFDLTDDSIPVEDHTETQEVDDGDGTGSQDKEDGGDGDGKDNAEETKKSDEAKGSDDEEEMPMIRMNSSIFEAQNDDEEDEDDEEGMDPEAIQSMMEVEMGEDSSGKSPKRKASTDEAVPQRRTPRRQAAVVASNTIRKISNLEKHVQEDVTDKGNDDVEYIDTVSTPSSRPTSGEKQSSNSEKQRCHQCKMSAPSLIVVRQYGTDIHLCSNNCFNTFRNPDPSFRPLPCAKCGVLNRDTENIKLYFWETMNFCSDLCVGNFQLQIGASCSTCSKRTPWTCMGKYCVRFGSDIRQFCTATCLETYKRNARVCFHCQLDIKKLGNVVLANIPTKTSPKEFCSQDCVEQYIEQNINNGNTTKNIPTIICHVCKTHKQHFKELVTAIMSYKVCSLHCWDKLLDLQMIRTPTKCETCVKFINMDTISISPSFYVATEKKAHGFCSATCKNVFVLKTRQIRPCTSCQVKKYNYDLIQHNGGNGAQHNFAVCSLNCLPKPSQYILSLKAKLADPSFIPPTVTIVTTATATLPTALPALTPVASSLPYETYNISLSNGGDFNYNGGDGYNQEIQIEGVSSLADGTVFMNGDGTYQYEPANVSGDQLMLREVSQEEFIQLRDAAGIVSLDTGNEVEVQTEEGDEVEGDYAPDENEMWADFDKIMALSLLPEPVQVRNKACQVRPIRFTKETQTDCSELADMPRIEPKVKVLILPVPVFIPFPVYSAHQPVPVPFPVGIPVPIPIPVILETVEPTTEPAVVTSPPSPLIPSSPSPLITSPPSPLIPSSPSPLIPSSPSPLIPSSPSPLIPSSPSPLIPSSPSPLIPSANVVVTEDISDTQPTTQADDTIEEADEVEMMDTSEPLEAESGVPETTSETNSNVFTFGSSNSPMSVGSPSLFRGTSSPAPAQGSPSVRGRGSKSEYGVRAWKLFFGDEDPAALTPEALSEKLVDWTMRGTKPKGDRYQPDTFLYFFLGIQQHLRANGRPDQIFYETVYTPFVVSFTAYAEQEMSRGCCISKVEEDHVWDANELGPISPGVLLFTLVYYIYKNFGLKTWEEHATLQFNQVKINERESSDGTQEKYVTITGIFNSDSELIEVAAEPENPYRCIVKLLEFYSSKCESTEGSFYKSIKLMVDPRADWYSNESLGQMDLYRMLVRAQMICFTPVD